MVRAEVMKTLQTLSTFDLKEKKNSESPRLFLRNVSLLPNMVFQHILKYVVL